MADHHIDVPAGTICGRLFKIERHPDGRHFRVTVDGMMHPAGKLPIRFKSMDRAVSHILNQGMQR